MDTYAMIQVEECKFFCSTTKTFFDMRLGFGRVHEIWPGERQISHRTMLIRETRMPSFKSRSVIFSPLLEIHFRYAREIHENRSGDGVKIGIFSGTVPTRTCNCPLNLWSLYPASTLFASFSLPFDPHKSVCERDVPI